MQHCETNGYNLVRKTIGPTSIGILNIRSSPPVIKDPGSSAHRPGQSVGFQSLEAMLFGQADSKDIITTPGAELTGRAEYNWGLGLQTCTLLYNGGA